VGNELVHASRHVRPLVVNRGMPSQGGSTGCWSNNTYNKVPWTNRGIPPVANHLCYVYSDRKNSTQQRCSLGRGFPKMWKCQKLLKKLTFHATPTSGVRDSLETFSYVVDYGGLYLGLNLWAECFTLAPSLPPQSAVQDVKKGTEYRYL